MGNELKFIELAKSFARDSELNRYEINGREVVLFDEPIAAIGDAHDLLFDKLSDPDIDGPHMIHPTEWLPDAESVISFFFPCTETLRQSMYPPGPEVSLEWLYGRYEGGKKFLPALCHELEALAESLNIKACAPDIDPRYKVVNKLANWSERHAGFISGLGSFGLHRMLITEKGCAGWVINILVNEKYPVTKRKYEKLYEYCTGCYQCIPRCPVGAINEERMDKSACGRFNDAVKELHMPRNGCSKCGLTVPCETGIPARS